MNKILNEYIKKFTDNILLSNTNIAHTDEKRYKLILINMSFIVTITVSFLFAIINTMQSSFLIVAIDIFMIIPSFLGIYYLRKGYDVNKLAIFMTILLFIGSLGIVIIRTGVEYTLVWSLLFPIAAIMLNGAKKGFYFSAVFIVMNFIIVYSFIDSSITMSGYIRFVSISIIIIIIIYFYESTMKNVFDMLKNSTTKVDELNKDLELKVELRTKKLNDVINEIKKVEYNLEEKHKTLEESQRIARIGSWKLNLITDELSWSNEIYNIFEIDFDKEPSYELFLQSIYPEDRDAVNTAYTTSLKDQSSYEIVHRLLFKDGRVKYVREQCETIFSDEGKPLISIGSVQDITNETVLQIKDYQQVQIIEQTHDSVISTDFSGIIIGWNHGAELMFGYTADEAIGRHISILYLKEELKHSEKSIEILKKTGAYKAEVYRITKLGEIICVLISLTVLKDEKGNPSQVVGFAQDITKRKLAEEKLLEQKEVLNHLAYHDSLTKLPNRVLFNDRLGQAIEKAKRNNTVVALLFIDLDHFKEINDSLGHEVGDEVLKIVSSRLKEVIRDKDTLARLGGDEFTVILEDLIQAQDASIIANKIVDILSKAINVNDNIFYVSSSIGISIYPDDGESAQNLLKYADSAMYKAKDEGRNNYQFYSPEMTELAFERVVMEASLRAAFENEEFVVYYQPQVNGVTDKLIGMEALVRWQHPTMGLIPPAKFIPLAEITGLIVELDRLVMKTAITQITKWYKDGLNPGVLAMNLSVKQLQQKDFIEVFESLMKETDCKAQWIELEVTEGQIMTNPDEAIKLLTKISDIGIKLAVDDFGTGYSSLAYLKRLPINKLKIDQIFVRDLPDDEEDAGITRAVIALSKSLNLRVIAEGVETIEQRDFLVENGCENIQGYYYSKPIPADEFEVILLNGLNI